MIIRELMVEVLACVAPNEMLSSAVSLMKDKALSCIIVNEKGKPKGIIT